MSLKPSKKSDLNKEWMSKRRDRIRKIQPEYHLIVSEGTNTEPNYFNSIKKQINSQYSERIHLEVFGEGTNTINLFEEAKQRAERNPNGYKHVWIIYDTDDFPANHIDRVPELCKQNTNQYREYHAVWSNQCIELWFLLHFSFFQSDIHRKEYWDKLSKHLKDISAGEYMKNRNDMFEVLKPYIQKAIENAKKLNKLNNGRPPSESAPGTMVYRLMEKLQPYIN